MEARSGPRGAAGGDDRAQRAARPQRGDGCNSPHNNVIARKHVKCTSARTVEEGGGVCYFTASTCPYAQHNAEREREREGETAMEH